MSLTQITELRDPVELDADALGQDLSRLDGARQHAGDDGVSREGGRDHAVLQQLSLASAQVGQPSAPPVATHDPPLGHDRMAVTHEYQTRPTPRPHAETLS